MGMMWGGSLLLLVLIAVVIWLLIPKARTPSTRERSPEEILRQRYARGEIDQDEYERRLKGLRE
jgi:putative membrane protein